MSSVRSIKVEYQQACGVCLFCDRIDEGKPHQRMIVCGITQAMTVP
jgi:hypothetical protein